LRALLDWWQACGVKGVIIGGVAASLLGRPRVTRDVDALVLLGEERWHDFLARGALLGFGPRLVDAVAFAQRSRVLLLCHQPSGIDVDLSFGSIPFEEELLERAVSVDVAGFTLPLPTPEDLIILKAVAHRPRDLVDIESVLDANPRLNRRRIRRWVREFTTALDMPELTEDLERLLSQRRKRKRKRDGP
jgi:hypothetical protein